MHVESKIQMWCESFPSVNGYNLPIEYVSKLSRVCVRERMCMNACALVDNLLWLKPILSVTFHSIPFRFCTEAFFLPSNVIYLHFSFRMVLRKKSPICSEFRTANHAIKLHTHTFCRKRVFDLSHDYHQLLMTARMASTWGRVLADMLN